MKHLNTYITEYIIKKKLDVPIYSEDREYCPKTKKDLINIIYMLLDKDKTDFNCIDTSLITDMSDLFIDSIFENLVFDVSKWDVSNVTNMDFMFCGCIKFDGDLSDWDVSNVKTMEEMFNKCRNFTGKGLENWDVSNVKNMSSMFSECESFEGKSIENWDVSNVENISYMFDYCTSLNCNLNNWNVSKVKKKTGVFQGTKGIKNKTSWYKTLK